MFLIGLKLLIIIYVFPWFIALLLLKYFPLWRFPTRNPSLNLFPTTILYFYSFPYRNFFLPYFPFLCFLFPLHFLRGDFKLNFLLFLFFRLCLYRLIRTWFPNLNIGTGAWFAELLGGYFFGAVGGFCGFCGGFCGKFCGNGSTLYFVCRLFSSNLCTFVLLFNSLLLMILRLIFFVESITGDVFWMQLFLFFPVSYLWSVWPFLLFTIYWRYHFWQFQLWLERFQRCGFYLHNVCQICILFYCSLLIQRRPFFECTGRWFLI